MRLSPAPAARRSANSLKISKAMALAAMLSPAPGLPSSEAKPQSGRTKGRATKNAKPAGSRSGSKPKAGVPSP